MINIDTGIKAVVAIVTKRRVTKMSQRTSHVYRLVTIPKVFEVFQRLLGAHNARRRFVTEIIQPTGSSRILDVGCGPGTLRPYLPRSCDYTGFDLNPQHIARAIEKHGDEGCFFVGDASESIPEGGDCYDIIICSAILHHLDDAEGRRLLTSLSQRLRPNGRLVTFDNVWLSNQRSTVKLLNYLDSGLNIRTPEAYQALVNEPRLVSATRIFSDLLRIPYDHFCMVLTREKQ